MEKYPQFDAGSRKLSGNIRDHINTATWTGNTDPAIANLVRAWDKGSAMAAEVLTADGLYGAADVDFKNLAEKPTMLDPFGAANGRPGVSTAVLVDGRQ